MHEGFGALTKADGDPEIWRPSIQASYGMTQKLNKDTNFAYSFAVYHCMTQLSLKQGIRAWGDNAIKAVEKEVQQMHDKKVYKPVRINTLTRQEKLAALIQRDFADDEISMKETLVESFRESFFAE